MWGRTPGASGQPRREAGEGRVARVGAAGVLGSCARRAARGEPIHSPGYSSWSTYGVQSSAFHTQGELYKYDDEAHTPSGPGAGSRGCRRGSAFFI